MRYICPKCANKNLILWENNQKATCESCLTTFDKDELIKMLIEIGKKHIEVIDHGLPDPTFYSGGVSNRNQKVLCPLCKNEFIQHVESGCFNITRMPPYCPKCGFNKSVIELKWKLKETD